LALNVMPLWSLFLTNWMWKCKPPLALFREVTCVFKKRGLFDCSALLPS
jgi:hypothetical protein